MAYQNIHPHQNWVGFHPDNWEERNVISTSEAFLVSLQLKSIFKNSRQDESRQ